ncbi:MAG: hypothetical protein R3C14_47810 [Caldilineaceae bacterium]
MTTKIRQRDDVGLERGEHSNHEGEIADLDNKLADSPVTQRFAELDYRLPMGDYNFEHFRTKHLISDVMGTVEARGIHPGEQAPDFTLPRTNGGELRLSALRGQPVLLHFGSPT